MRQPMFTYHFNGPGRAVGPDVCVSSGETTRKSSL